MGKRSVGMITKIRSVVTAVIATAPFIGEAQLAATGQKDWVNALAATGSYYSGFNFQDGSFDITRAGKGVGALVAAYAFFKGTGFILKKVGRGLRF